MTHEGNWAEEVERIKVELEGGDTIIYWTPKCYSCGTSTAVRVTPQQYLDLLERDQVTNHNKGRLTPMTSGKLIQDIFPGSTAGYRELIKTGFHPACWIAEGLDMSAEDYEEEMMREGMQGEGDDEVRVVCTQCTTAAGYPPDHAIKVRVTDVTSSRGFGAGLIHCTTLECGHQIVEDNDYAEV